MIEQIPEIYVPYIIGWVIAGVFIFLFSNGVLTVQRHVGNKHWIRLLIFMLICGPVMWLSAPVAFFLVSIGMPGIGKIFSGDPTKEELDKYNDRRKS